MAESHQAAAGRQLLEAVDGLLERIVQGAAGAAVSRPTQVVCGTCGAAPCDCDGGVGEPVRPAFALLALVNLTLMLGSALWSCTRPVPPPMELCGSPPEQICRWSATEVPMDEDGGHAGR